MLIPTIVMAVLAVIFFVVASGRGDGAQIEGLKIAGTMTLQVLPLLFFAFVVAGMVQVVIPREVIARWIGEEAGLRGILTGTLAGSLAPGGPFVSLPVAAGLIRAGAGIGTMVAFLTGWSLWAVSRLPLEVGILGWRLTLIRLVSTFLFPPLAGLIAHWIFGGRVAANG
jgi:uncharacterized membrane protein YraQ (UPF0718 family)